MIKIVKVKAFENRIIEIEYNDGVQGSFNYEDYFSYEGIFSPLKNIEYFKKIKIVDDVIQWNDEIDFCPEIIRSIISKEKIIIDGKIVFDPSLGKNAWFS